MSSDDMWEGFCEVEMKNHSKKIDAKKTRAQWKKPWNFVFATAGCTIGLGNVWRFPYLCFKNGGGAFLLPYLLSALFLGIPLLLLEMSIGQKVRKGLIQSWAIIPIFKGIGLASAVILVHANVCYPILLTWCLKYFVSSFSTNLPWTSCHNDWNTADCVTPSVVNTTGTNSSNPKSAGEEFWNYGVLGITSGIEDVGKLKPDLVLFLAILWVAIYFTTFKGIKWTAKVAYVTATAPFILIAILVVRGATLDGASDGIVYYLYPNVTKLMEIEVWTSAGSQVLYSYSVCFGSSVVLGSYNKINHNVIRDSIIIGVMNSVTSFVSGFAIFSTLGFMAKYKNTTIDEVAQSGPGLAFTVYPEALSLLPLPQFWTALFFLVLLTLGFDSMFVFQECIASNVIDNVPRIRKLRYNREIVQAVLGFLMFLVGLLMVTEGGVYIFEIYNNYGVSGWCLYAICLCEFVAVGWIYGLDRYWDELMAMIGPHYGKMWFKICCKYTGPPICVLVVVYYLATTSLLTYGDYVYPVWAQMIAHIMSLSSFIWIPAYAIFTLVKKWKGRKKDEKTQQTKDDKDSVMHEVEMRML